MLLLTRSLHPTFGVEVSGVDLRHPLDQPGFTAIRNALDEHGVLIFPGQTLDGEQQAAFARRFGPLEADGGDGGPALDAALNALWHSARSFHRVPAMATLLYASEVPPRGGEAEFADMCAAWESLPAGDRRGLEGLVVEHSLAHSHGLIGAPVTEAERAAAPPVPQALVRIHPVSGRKSLYLGAHASHLVGRPVEEGRAVLRALTEFATAPKFVLRHAWRVGDLAVWDERRVLHRGRPWDEARHRRVLHRTTVAGDGPTLSGDVARAAAGPA